MDTIMTIKAFGKNAAPAIEEAELYVENLENTISAVKEGSRLFIINNSINENFSITEPDLIDILLYSLEAAEKTDGAFNPLIYSVTKEWGFTNSLYKVPSDEKINELMAQCDFTKVKVQLNSEKSDEGQKSILKLYKPVNASFDFGALGKGFAADRILEILKKYGIESALLDLGGNIQLLGKKPDSSLWKVGIKNPLPDSNQKIPIALTLSDCAVVTSGGYERYFTSEDGRTFIHILDGRTGYPVNNGILSASAVSSSGLYADFLSTSLFVLGKAEALEYWRNHKDFDFILIMDDFSLSYTSGLKDKIQLLDDFSSVEILE
ncbi:MAG: FAD:protein FMN transferase [Treponema sp.]|nr:FAD:protein FMN transferase [Treponema sp.]